MEQATANAGSPIGWVRGPNKVELTPENLEKIRAVTELNLNHSNTLLILNDLSDIKWFTGLTHLNCSQNELTALDVSGCLSLTTLYCWRNALTTLDVSANGKLTDLKCSSNCLKELDISGNKALQTWTCGLQTVDKADKKEQELTLILTEEQNRLWETTESTVYDNKGVTVIVLGDGGEVISNGFTLNQSELWLTVNETAELIATVNPTMATNKKVRWSATPDGVVTLTDKGDGSCTVMLAKEGTATVTVTTEDSGKTAQCEVKFVEVIDNRDFIKAVGTQCDWTVEENGTVKLTPENENKMSKVGMLDIHNQGLSDLSDIKYFTGLFHLDCRENQLSVLDVSENSSLEYLNCAGNQLTELNLGSLNNKLKQLFCHLNHLTALDVSMHSKLEMLQCGNQTSDGTTPQNLDLRLKSSQKGKLNESLSGPFNENVTIREISG
ncbi:MAG: Ig-like domain-containing protein [Candidatus Treponema excrementipullorum]|nr:Ig-like domain-containing protein [Spirochaetia bacterium]MDD7012302.1 Ig-like domain-containing protein [Candidatus Treponema excrementipullorum]MDY4708378.1 Ig-like domain-containing protein [Candidatus Treponema excrementipullorum]